MHTSTQTHIDNLLYAPQHCINRMNYSNVSVVTYSKEAYSETSADNFLSYCATNKLEYEIYCIIV